MMEPGTERELDYTERLFKRCQDGLLLRHFLLEEC